MELKNVKWSLDQFMEVRSGVLGQWETGSGVDLQDAVEYQNGVAPEKRFAPALMRAKEAGITLAQPRAGVATVEGQIELLLHLQNVGLADLLPVTIDSYTRQNRYRECIVGLEESKKTGRSMLNGFPAVNHGVAGCRELFEAVGRPLQARHGTPDARLLSEIVLASGWTSNEGGGISYNIPYAKSVSLERSLLDWQYCDRLVGLYEEMGIRINREPFGPLTGTLVPPSMSNAVMILEGLLAAEQGVKSLTLGYGQGGHLLQDVAAVRALEEQAGAYFREFGYDDIEITTVFHQWMGGFPQDEAQAFGVVCLGAQAAALAGATKVIVKTPHEAAGVPTKEANAQGILATQQTLRMLRGQRMAMSKQLQEEIALIKAETKCLLDKVQELGEGDFAVGAVRAFQAGVLDVPFAPSKHNAGQMLPARDNSGAIRYLEFGQIAFSQDIKDHNRALLEERAQFEGRSVSFQMVIDDIYAVSKGTLVGRPV
ncbi:methylaspartate mutase subunit E [Tumebacillus algifaecis]|uniref:Glutamate mutase epsilon subunit n=1 Tax=Tumebacillus algifaecis TaxID=1214604 RepID=A0A223CXS4_9BACL|nr:methylaspartate mutase subunit E [Tumebacillus algifaecis]ASS74118.1 methylaspartate mutase subunit E [Tumebacillus algifaecis]